MEVSARRIRRAREHGDVPRSAELTAAAAFAVVALALVLGGGFLMARLGGLVKKGVEAATAGAPDLSAALSGAAADLFALSAPLLGAAALAALAVGVAQTGGLFTLRRGRTRAGGGSPILRVLAAIAVAAAVVVPALPDLGRLSSAAALAAFFGEVVARLLGLCVVALAFVGAFDLYRARRRFLERMRASRQEELREGRETEGDPRVRAAIRRRTI